MLRTSPANMKLKKLAKHEYLAKTFLSNKKKVVSLDLLSGYSCPFAKECLSKVIIDDEGKRKIRDGPDTKFRCFSASQEALYPKTYDLRKANFDILKMVHYSWPLMSMRITSALPQNTGIVRIHVAGDFFNEEYFKAWLYVAEDNPGILFYAYTKSLRYWIKHKVAVDKLLNFILTASYGGRNDHLIPIYGLRSAKVVYSENEAKKLNLPIDFDDSHAANPITRNDDFALLIHGIQPKGSKASKALWKLKGKGSYGKTKLHRRDL